MTNKNKIITQLNNCYDDDKKAFHYLEKLPSLPFLSFDEIHTLIKNNMWHSLIFLINHDAIDIHYKNIENENILLISATEYNFKKEHLYLDFIDCLIKKNVDINCKNSLNQNLLLVLLNNKKSLILTPSFIDKLEKRGLVIHDQDQKDYSLSSSISRYANHEIFNYLYPKCQKNYKDTEGNNMLLNACANPNIEILKFLIQEGFVDCVNQYGKNACNIALDNREINNYKYLIENNISHPNEIKDEILLSFSQSFNHYYMLRSTHLEQEAKNWLKYYFDTIDLSLMNSKQIQRVYNTYSNFTYIDEFSELSQVLYEKKMFDKDNQTPFFHNNKIKI